MPPLKIRQARRIPRPIRSGPGSDHRGEAMLSWSQCRLLGIRNRWLSPTFGLRMSSAFALVNVQQETGPRLALPSTSASASEAERRAIVHLSQAQFVRLRPAIRELFQIYPHPRRSVVPLLDVAQTRHYVSATVRIEDATARQIDQYAAFMKTSADEVVDKALAYVFAKDKDFQEFLETPEAARVQSSLRVRTSAGANGSAPEPANGSAKAAKSVEISHDLRQRSQS